MTKETMKKRRSARSILLSLMIIIIALFAISCYVRSEAKNRVPANIREMGEKYPEAKEYVEGYFEYKDADLSMDVTKEMEEREIPLFIQWDKRWGYKNYGGNYIGVAGCGPTCLAMVVCGLNNDASINPYVVATYAADSHFYRMGEGTSWDLMTKGALNYGIKARGGEISAEYILKNLSEDSPMICSMKPGDFTYTGHFIVLTGVDDDGNIIVNDPNSRNNSKKHWDVDTLVSQIKAIWVYRR